MTATPLHKRRCFDCPFDTRMSAAERTKLLADYDCERHRFDNGEEMLCHTSGPEGCPPGERDLRRCRGFYNLAERHRREKNHS